MNKLFTLLLIISSGCGLVQVRSSKEMNSMLEKQKASLPQFKQESSKNWKYGTQIDPMDNSVTYMAVSHSKNKVNLSFPYHGGTQAKIGLVKYSNGHRVASIEVTKGQISFNHIAIGRLEEMRVKFGNDNLESYEIKIPQNTKNDYLVIYNQDRFIRNLNQYKTAKIQLRFFRDGLKTFEFATDELQSFFLE
ncbi:hypothetical protein [Peredibacter starrii]|uniref:Lipoprotein n=1 Tax=Peredibacter starrii TaxID=28202 RepID=A0AAX4HRV0_9BACT|nr:hypothetical protein [Peredibacter starrii]WPU65903.1 hypothetical protein SOO65_04010 [Peredibacter starrii]